MTLIASTPTPPYYAVIFTSVRTADDIGYKKMAEKMVALASKQPGFLGVESAREDIGITVSYCIVYWNEPDGHQWEMLTVSYAR